jgi:hypothetical protein
MDIVVELVSSSLLHPTQFYFFLQIVSLIYLVFFFFLFVPKLGVLGSFF